MAGDTVRVLCREPIVLASGSASRRAMFEAAGLAAVLDPPNVDEAALKQVFRRDGRSVEDAALGLAEAKAAAVDGRHSGRIVIAADQMLECGGTWFDKPVDRASARAQLQSLAGRTHRLVSAAVATRDGRPLWSAVECAELTMRRFSAEFLDSYLDLVGDRVLSSVGGYQIEGLGIQLFSEVRGDHFTILGLPLLRLLGFLRAQGVLPA